MSVVQYNSRVLCTYYINTALIEIRGMIPSHDWLHDRVRQP